MIVGTVISVGIDHRQVGAHVDVGARRHRVVEGEDRVRERLDDLVVGRARMVPREDAAHEGPVDRTPVPGPELGQPLPPLHQRRAPLARPHEGVQRQAPDALRVALGEQGRAESARRDAVRQVRADAAGSGDVVRRHRQVVGAGRDVGVDVAMLVRPPVALHVHAPRVVAQTGEVVHRRGVRPARDLEVEGRLGTHRGAVDEQDRPPRRRRSDGGLLPEEQAHRPLRGSSAHARATAGSAVIRQLLSPWPASGAREIVRLRTRCRRRGLEADPQRLADLERRPPGPPARARACRPPAPCDSRRGCRET